MGLHEILKSGEISHNICTPLFVGISPSIEPETVNTSALKHGPQTVLKSPTVQASNTPHLHLSLSLPVALSVSFSLSFSSHLLLLLLPSLSSCPWAIHGADYSSFNDHLSLLQRCIVPCQAKQQASPVLKGHSANWWPLILPTQAWQPKPPTQVISATILIINHCEPAQNAVWQKQGIKSQNNDQKWLKFALINLLVCIKHWINTLQYYSKYWPS